MNEEITFLPWLRRGLAQALETTSPLRGAILRGPTVNAWVDVLDAHAERTVRLHGPDQVAGLAPGQVLRSEPRPDSVAVEPTLFPYVELAAPDLPWLYTPSAPDSSGKLRPWLVLAVVREQEGVHLDTPAGELPVLRFESPARPAEELPDLADAWAWAHVQSLVGLEGAAAAVAAGSGEVVARLLCPRRLSPGSTWLACLVPAFDGGVARGLGKPVPDGTDWLPAWELRGVQAPLRLPVYHHWRFATGPDGDFEALCRRLQPDDSGAAFGLHAMDVTDPGLVRPARDTVLLDFQGALQTLGVSPRPWDPSHREPFQRDLEPLLNAAAVRTDVTPPAPGEPYEPATQDPVVGPPLHGRWPAGVTRVPGEGWVRTLNLDPPQRAAAGLGAHAVQAAQEELVAGAWKQAGALRGTVAALNQGRLAVEIGRCLSARFAALSGGDVLHVTAPLHAVLGGATQSVAARLRTSAVPAGLVSTAHLRQTRPGAPLARDWRALAGSPAARLGAEHVDVTLDATGAGVEQAAALTFAVYERLFAAQLSDPTLTATVPPLERGGASAGQRPPAAPPRPARTTTQDPLPSGGDDVSDLAVEVIAGLDPLSAVRASLLARVPALDGLLPEDALPTTVTIGPTFGDALYDDLVRLGAGYLLPGARQLGRNRVRLVGTNATFVGAFLVGANHELARELLWRDYPVDLRATFFRRFWDYVDAGRSDIPPLQGWKPRSSIPENMASRAEPMTVVVVRGDLVRRHPTAHYFLQKAQLDDDGLIAPVPGEVAAASFRGALGADALFVGFALPPEEVIGDRPGGRDFGWLFAIEEQPAAPRFGLDDPSPGAAYGERPKSWNDLSWADVAASEAELATLSHAPVDVAWLASAPISGSTWGDNAAHMARACWQRPFRMFIPADQLV